MAIARILGLVVALTSIIAAVSRLPASFTSRAEADVRGAQVSVSAHGNENVAPHMRHSEGAIRPTGAMLGARAAHTATLLRDGRILVVGGLGSGAPAAEFYDPTAGRFAAADVAMPMRQSHSATPLADGTILIVGGFDANGTVISAAVRFDPLTNRSIATDDLRTARAGHIAVRLADGRVLIAGGVGSNWTFLSSAELYDPSTQRFIPVGDMSVARESHIAILLRDGKVVVIGGHVGRRNAMQLHASAEVYDPSSGTFMPTGSMHTARHKHDAVLLLDGRVLVTGGADRRDAAGIYRSTEIFDPARGEFVGGPDMRLPRYKHAGSSITLPNGDVLLAGGAAQAEVFEAATRRFRLVAGAQSLAGQFSATARLADGRVLITGGYGPDRGPQHAAWVFSP